ncbi:CDP-glycerol glycerophosphotransferase family protein [Galactobacter valiniphilus]|uniref:CDP-glycerol glycerophosphotransferase family protein n=1 Tax=Galactobacter valiniphilus TaxID=2676122 RepID=UPI003736D180
MQFTPRTLARAVERRVASARLWPVHRRVMSLPPRVPNVVLAVAARSARRAKDLQGAIGTLEPLVRRRPRWTAGRMRLASLLRETGQHGVALGHYDAVADGVPDNVAAWKAIADLSLAEDNVPHALSALERLEALGASKAFVLQRTADCYRRLGRRWDEVGVLTTWLERSPKNAEARRRRASALEACGLFDSALADALALPAAWRKRAAVARQLRRLSIATGAASPSDAHEALERGRVGEAARLSKNPAEAARLHLAAGEYPQALEALEALAGSEGAEALRLGASALELQGLHLEAAARYAEAASLGEWRESLDVDGVADLRFAQGRALLAAGRFDEAVAALRTWNASSVKELALPAPDANAPASAVAAWLFVVESTTDPVERARALRQARGALGRADAGLTRREAAAWREAGDLEAELEAWTRAVRFASASSVDRAAVLTSESKLRRALFAQAQDAPLLATTVLFQSSRASRLHCNPLAIYRQLAKDPRSEHWTFVWASNRPEAVPADVAADARVRFVQFNSADYVEALGRAAWVVNNVTFPDYYNRRPDQKYLNTWHGTPLKGLGRFAKDTFLSYSNVARNVLQATHLGLPNLHTAVAMEDGMGLRGVVPAQIMVTGSPRLDASITMSEADRTALRARLGVDDGKPVVLFAPTWKGALGNVTAPTGLVAELEAMAGDGHHLLFRAHRLAERGIAGMQLPAKTVPADVDTNELLAVVDVLVTDYSSICFDFLPMDRPVIFHVPDRAEYERDRGFQPGLDEWPGEISTSVDSTREAVARAVRGAEPADARARRARGLARFCSAEDGRAAERTVEAFFFEHELPNAVSRLDAGRVRISAERAAVQAEAWDLRPATPGETEVPVLELVQLGGIPDTGKAFVECIGDLPHVLTAPGGAYTAEERYTEALARRTGSACTPMQLRWLESAAVREARRRWGALEARWWLQRQAESAESTALIRASASARGTEAVVHDLVDPVSGVPVVDGRPQALARFDAASRADETPSHA